MRWHETEIIAGDININIIDHNRIKTHNYITVLEKNSFISLINIPSTELEVYVKPNISEFWTFGYEIRIILYYYCLLSLQW